MNTRTLSFERPPKLNPPQQGDDSAIPLLECGKSGQTAESAPHRVVPPTDVVTAEYWIG